MPHYMYQVAYSSEAWASLVKTPQDRIEAVRPAVRKLGGKIESAYYAFGDYDLIAIVNMPDNVSAAAFSIAASAGGSVIGPLNPDFYLDLSTAIPNSTFLPKSMGTLDASGKGQAAFVLPKISNQNAIGLIFNHAYVVYDAKDNYYMASNPVSLRLVR